jgi:hypothetical protein
MCLFSIELAAQPSAGVVIRSAADNEEICENEELEAPLGHHAEADRQETSHEPAEDSSPIPTRHE